MLLIPEISVESSPTIFPFAFILPANVPTPVTLSPVVFPNILKPLAVTTPTESTFVTSS